MKDYLTTPLSEDERKLILGIIWRTAYTFRNRLNEKKTNEEISLDDVTLYSEDKYYYGNSEGTILPGIVRPLAQEEKERIVEYVDNILIELWLEDLIVALTFEEKLVLFLCLFQKYTEDDASIFIGLSKRTIANRKTSIKSKKPQRLGGILNV